MPYGIHTVDSCDVHYRTSETGNELPYYELPLSLDVTEHYIGGKPHKPNKTEDFEPSKRGRGTEKDTI